MKVLFLDIDGVLQPYSSYERFEHDLDELVKDLSVKYNSDYSIYDKYDVGACYYDWDVDAVNRIKRILDDTDSKIVVSSDWRHNHLTSEPVTKMEALLRIWDLDKYLVGETEYYDIFSKDENQMAEAHKYLDSLNLWHSCRARAIEIIDYVLNHKEVTNFVAIDDMDISSGLEGHFVETNILINDEQMEEAIKILQSK